MNKNKTVFNLDNNGLNKATTTSVAILAYKGKGE